MSDYAKWEMTLISEQEEKKNVHDCVYIDIYIVALHYL